jgi:hypothetical protein
MKILEMDKGIHKVFLKLFRGGQNNVLGAIMAGVYASIGTRAAKKGLDWRDSDVLDRVYREWLVGKTCGQELTNPRTGAKYRLKFAYPADLVQLAATVSTALKDATEMIVTDEAKTLALATLVSLGATMPRG